MKNRHRTTQDQSLLPSVGASSALPAASPRLLYSRRDAAYLLSESIRSIDYKLANGTLRYIRQGGRVKIPHAELLRQAAIDDNTPIVPRCRPGNVSESAKALKAA